MSVILSLPPSDPSLTIDDFSIRLLLRIFPEIDKISNIKTYQDKILKLVPYVNILEGIEFDRDELEVIVSYLTNTSQLFTFQLFKIFNEYIEDDLDVTFNERLFELLGLDELSKGPVVLKQNFIEV